METKNKVFIICFILILSVFCYSLKMTWAVPAGYQAIQDVKEVEWQGPAVAIDVPQVEYTVSNLRDPFEPEPVKEEDDEEEDKTLLPVPPSPLPYLDIQGIVWGSELPQAIINNKVVKIGDVVEDVRVVDISKKGITVFYNGRQQLIASPAANMLGDLDPNPEGGMNEESE
jgi:hypothetical protein